MFSWIKRKENVLTKKEMSSKEVGKSAFSVLLHELEDERYDFGEPWQLTSESLSAVVPILRRFIKERGYLVLQEISKDKIIVTDSGQIGKVNVRIKDVDKPVFVRAGTIFKGQGTQSRTSGMGMILECGKESSIDVFCVHATHSISAHLGFLTASDVVPRKVEEVLTSPSRNQSKVWASATLRKWRAPVRHCPRCGSSGLLQTYEAELVCTQCGNAISPLSINSPALQDERRMRFSNWVRDDLVANLGEMSKFNNKVEDFLSKVPADLENQVGIVMIDSSGMYGLEMFDHPDSWRAFSKSIVRNYADVLAKERAEEGLFALKTERIPEAIKKFLQKAYGLSETLNFKNRISETRMLSGELIGEYSVLGPDVIHLILKRKTSA